MEKKMDEGGYKTRVTLSLDNIIFPDLRLGSFSGCTHLRDAVSKVHSQILYDSAPRQ